MANRIRDKPQPNYGTHVRLSATITEVARALQFQVSSTEAHIT